MVYSPEEDSYLLSDTLKLVLKNQKNKQIKILDLGSGSGIQAETCLKLGFSNIICSDIDKQSIRFLKSKFKKTKIKIIHSDLFEKIKSKFDLIIFNPPYLSKHKFDKKSDTSGGEQGDETILAFITQAITHLTEQGKILLLISSLTPKTRINSLIKKLNLNKKKLAEKKLFFEKLEIFQIKTLRKFN